MITRSKEGVSETVAKVQSSLVILLFKKVVRIMLSLSHSTGGQLIDLNEDKKTQGKGLQLAHP